MSYTRKVAYNTAAQFIGKIVGLAIALVTTAILFRFLGVEGVGKYTTAFSFVAFFTLFSDVGLNWTLLRELSINEDKDKIFKNIFTLRFFLGIIVYAFAAATIWLFNYPPDVKLAVGVLSGAIFFQSLVSAGVQVYLNFYRMDIAVLAEVAGKALILLGVYIVSIKGGSLSMVMFAYGLGCLLNFIIIWVFAGKFVKTGFSFDFAYWKKALRMAIPIGITLVFGFIYYKVDSIMLSLMKSMTDVGIYGAAYKILEVLQMFPSLFLGASFSLVTQYVNNRDERIHSAFQKEFDFLTLIGVPIVIGTFILARQIIAFIGGPEGFTTSSTVSVFGIAATSVTSLRILIFSVGFNFITLLYSFMIVSLGKQKQMIWPTLIFAFFNIGLNLLLIPKYSYIGASFATLLTEAFVLLVSRYIVNKNIPLKVSFSKSYRIILIGLLMGISTYVFVHAGIGLILNLALSTIIYILLAILFQVVPQDMLKSVLKLKSN
jgi:O-antigen/teichoic acid export membrane protein